MSLADKFEIIADEVYDKGKADYETMITAGFTRRNYCGAFLQSDLTGHEFSQTIYPTTGIERMFNAYAGTELPKGIDCSRLDCNKSATYYRFAFEWAAKLRKIPDIGIPAIPYYTNTYSNCKELVEIEVIRCNKNTLFQNPFTNCKKLTTFKIEGEIGTDFDCSDLYVTPATMYSVLTHLVNYSKTSNAYKYSVLFPKVCWDELNEWAPPPSDSCWEDYVTYLGWCG